MSQEIVIPPEVIGEPDQLAAQIGNYWLLWDSGKSVWKQQVMEVRSYVFATDTTTTTNNKLPWKNKTTLPKLTQIRDNLFANYKSALFSSEDWLTWEPMVEAAADIAISRPILGYFRYKLRLNNFEEQVDQQLLDYIDCGNAFGYSYFEKDLIEKKETGETTEVYVGPRMERISPHDIVFNPAAFSFEKSPKIIRTVITLGDLMRMRESRPDLNWDDGAIKKIQEDRQVIGTVSGGSQTSPMEKAKADAYRIDGFGSLYSYFASGYVEVLLFFGDIYDSGTNQLYRDRIIAIADRRYVLYNQENPSWHGEVPIRHVGWRTRQDNLWAMGPLDNLVGMQYRIDHLENLKADAFDMIAYPMLKIKGDVEHFSYGPGERIYTHDEGDVEFMHPDTTVLTADNQIAILVQQMEEFAGAPKEAMGIRTPGEKTAYEVQQLMTAAGRIFQEKITNFEKFLEKILNDMLEQARRNLDVEDIAKVTDKETGVVEFLKIDKNTIKTKGKVIPMGARHFAEQAKKVQELTAFANSSLGQDPSVTAHISGFELAKTFEKLLGVEKYNLVVKNIRVLEQFETQQVMQQAQQQLQVEGSMPIEPEEVPDEAAAYQDQLNQG